MSKTDFRSADLPSDSVPPQGLDSWVREYIEQTLAKHGKAGERIPTKKELEAIASETVRAVVPKLGETIADRVITELPSRLPDIRADRALFEKVLRAEWGPALDILEALTQHFYHFGRDYLLAAVRDGSAKEDIKIQVIGRLHARAVRTATEVLRLLEAGLPDGAFARWRTLHELAMVALILSDHSSELADRYQLHETVRIRGAMREFEKHQAELGWPPVAEGEQSEADRKVKLLRDRFGKGFTSHDLGWIVGMIPLKRAGRPTFADIERAVGLEKLRPFFGWASESVHGGAHGLRSLGMPAYFGDVLYAGGSTSGLADPGQNAALSIAHFVGAVMKVSTTLESLAVAHSLVILAERCQDAFIQAHITVEEKTRGNVKAARSSGV